MHIVVGRGGLGYDNFFNKLWLKVFPAPLGIHVSKGLSPTYGFFEAYSFLRAFGTVPANGTVRFRCLITMCRDTPQVDSRERAQCTYAKGY